VTPKSGETESVRRKNGVGGNNSGGCCLDTKKEIKTLTRSRPECRIAVCSVSVSAQKSRCNMATKTEVKKADIIEELEYLYQQVVQDMANCEASAILCDDGSVTISVDCDYSDRLACDIFAISARINRIEFEICYVTREV
jgi:hypothetical protein